MERMCTTVLKDEKSLSIGPVATRAPPMAKKTPAVGIGFILVEASCNSANQRPTIPTLANWDRFHCAHSISLQGV
jgi:hypothetical protein